MSDAVSHARTLIDRGDVRGAAMALRQAEQAGDALAARELALWCLSGELVRRDLATSRLLFERAAALGDTDSAAISRAFIAAGIGGPADWPRALEMLRAAAATEREAAEQIQIVEAMALGPNGEPLRPFASETLSGDPEVRRFPALFTPGECAYLIAVAAPGLQPSFVVDPYSGKQVPNPIRTSSGVGFPFISENPAIHALNRRLAAASGSDVRAGEPLQVLRYEPGEQYHQHSDALPAVPPHQQRVLTFLVYLDDDYEGGETSFPLAGLNVRGRTGDGLLFRNASADGMPDPRSVHAGLPVTRGVKHLASRWIRAAPLQLD